MQCSPYIRFRHSQLMKLIKQMLVADLERKDLYQFNHINQL